MSEDFISNLRLLCAYHGSVSDVCRAIGINRAQFTKYLSGTSFPSRRNLQRIIDFFGVEDYEIRLPRDQFANIVRLYSRRVGGKDQLPRGFEGLGEDLRRHQAELSRFHGYFFKYFPSFSTDGKVLRSLVQVGAHQGITCYRTIERLRSLERPAAGSPIFKYQGVLLLKGSRLHMIDREQLVGHEISQTILYLPNKSRPTRLMGLMIGVCATEANEPVAARVMLDSLGSAVDRRQALAACGLLELDDPSLDPAIRDYVVAGTALSGGLLRAPPL